MRILIAISHFYPTVGGAERQVLQLACQWREMGHETRVLSRRLAGLTAREVVEGVEVRREIRTVDWGPLFGLSYLATLTWALWRQGRKFDVLLAGQTRWEAVAVSLAGWLLGKPAVSRLSSVGPAGDLAATLGARGGWLWGKLFRRLTRVFCPTREAVEEAARLGFERRRLVLLEHGVDTARFAPPAARGAQARLTVLAVGRLAEVKAPRLLLDAWEELGWPEARLRWAGAGPLEAEMRQRVASRAALSGVELLGERHDIAELAQQAGVFALMSPSEGCSNALLEAMASGLCVVARKVAGNLGLVEDGVNGLLVEGDRPSDVAAVLRRALSEPELAERLGRAARSTVLRRHGMTEVAMRAAETLERALADSTRRA